MSYIIILESGVVVRNTDGKLVAPCQSVDDVDYQAYVAWVKSGNEPTVGVYAQPLPVPASVTPRQIRLALTHAGLRSTVEAAVAESDQATKDTWQFSTEILRNNPMLMAMAAMLGKTDEEMDALFILAGGL